MLGLYQVVETSRMDCAFTLFFRLRLPVSERLGVQADGARLMASQ